MSQDWCLRCKGACCEELAIPVPAALEMWSAGEAEQNQVAEWMAVRGEVERAHLMVEAPCPMLDGDGLCSIYEERPQLCRDFEPGGEYCRFALSRRRTPEQIAEITGQPVPSP